MTLDTLLGYISVFDNELAVDADQPDEKRAIRAVNIVQGWFESVVAGISEMFQTYGTVTTGTTETTAWPTGLLRLDALWYCDPTTGLPIWKLEPIKETGGHRPSVSGVQSLVSHTPGKITDYFAQGPHSTGKLFWNPVPDVAQTLRCYGLYSGTTYTARGNTFVYPDHCAPTFAQQTAKILRMGKDDDITDLRREADASLRAAIKACDKWWNDGEHERHYSQSHDT